MSQLTVVYDACVLYPAPLRSFLMYLAMTGLYRARWTNDIHEEWMRNVQKDYLDFTRQQAEKIRDLMNAHVVVGIPHPNSFASQRPFNPFQLRRIINSTLRKLRRMSRPGDL